MSATPTSAPPRSQSEVAYEALRDMLVRLEIAPGEPLGESELMALVGVGRTPLREALNRLADERLVVKYPRRGTFAAEINLADLGPLTEVREELEGLAAAGAAKRATREDIEVLEGLLRRLDQPPPAEPDSAMQLDVAIHRALYAAAHNPFLAETATRYHNMSTRIWYVFMDRLSGLGDHVEEHRLLLGHVLAGEPEAARDVARHHVANFAQAVRALL